MTIYPHFTSNISAKLRTPACQRVYFLLHHSNTELQNLSVRIYSASEASHTKWRFAIHRDIGASTILTSYPGPSSIFCVGRAWVRGYYKLNQVCRMSNKRMGGTSKPLCACVLGNRSLRRAKLVVCKLLFSS